MQITTLGTSHGYNTAGNFYTSTLVETENGSFLIDAGCQADTMMIHAGKDAGKIKAIFITHPHTDHMGGIISTMKDIERKSGKTQKYTVYLPEDLEAAIRAWADAIHVGIPNASFVFYKEGVIYDDGALKVEAIQSHHLKINDEYVSYSFVVETEGKRVLFTGDLSCDAHDFPTVSAEKEFDLCVSESTHFKPHHVAEALGKARFKRIIFNHIWDEWRTPEGEAEWLRGLSNVTCPMEFAREGKTYEI
ncbi:MAG: ribonuclease Z [Clostridia bacterium]|nr:ribonuclease Z [Clostridia bacterium]